MENKKPSYIDNLNLDDQKRRLSEAGVNRRPSAAHVLTEGKLTVWLKYEVFLDVFDDDEDDDDDNDDDHDDDEDDDDEVPTNESNCQQLLQTLIHSSLVIESLLTEWSLAGSSS